MHRSRETGLGAAMLGLLLAAVFFAANVKAEGLRFEGSIGICPHRYANDTSWSYRDWGNYQTNMPLSPKCWQFAVSHLPFELDGVKLGYRLAYVDLGTITADNTYPVNEQAYFTAKDTRTAVQSDTARFQGNGRSRGFSVGLAAETHRYGLDLGAEVGLALLRSTWHVQIPDSISMAGCRADWACADGNQITPYFGVNARWKYLFVSIRQYQSVHASQSERNYLFIGPTSGAVVTAMAGLSVEI